MTQVRSRESLPTPEELNTAISAHRWNGIRAGYDLNESGVAVISPRSLKALKIFQTGNCSPNGLALEHDDPPRCVDWNPIRARPT
jgi:hypothetical protein